jgi:hypothetical protein
VEGRHQESTLPPGGIPSPKKPSSRDHALSYRVYDYLGLPKNKTVTPTGAEG